MAKKVTKKVDVKKVEKANVMEIVAKALAEAGYEVKDGENFGFTAGTVVVRGAKCDVQLKPINPKVGVDRYEELVEEEEVVEEVVVEEQETEVKVEGQEETGTDTAAE